MTARMALLEKLTLQAPHLSTKSTIPALVYGTAWKKEATTDLVFQALSNGFTGIDTACQPKHYREDLVGEGLRKALAQKVCKRSDLYLQTKFTSVNGQDPSNIPYDPKQSIPEQVKQSISRSLEHFDISTVSESTGQDTYLDTVVLHSPMRTIDETMEVWRALETCVPKTIRNIGISNCDLFTLMDVYERSKIKPAVVQNRFYPRTKWDIGIRRFCLEKGIIYQTFWTLTGNPELLASQLVQEASTYLNVSVESALYCLVLSLGNTVILDGTKNVQHMQEAHAALTATKAFAEQNSKVWKNTVDAFKKLIGEPPQKG